MVCDLLNGSSSSLCLSDNLNNLIQPRYKMVRYTNREGVATYIVFLPILAT